MTRLFDVRQPLGTPPVPGQCTVTYLLSLPSAKWQEVGGGIWSCVTPAHQRFYCAFQWALWPLQHGKTDVHAC